MTAPAATEAPTVEPVVPRGKVRKKIRKKLGKYLRVGDVLVGTVANFVPPACAIGEAKEIVEESLDRR